MALSKARWGGWWLRSRGGRTLTSWRVVGRQSSHAPLLRLRWFQQFVQAGFLAISSLNVVVAGLFWPFLIFLCHKQPVTASINNNWELLLRNNDYVCWLLLIFAAHWLFDYLGYGSFVLLIFGGMAISHDVGSPPWTSQEKTWDLTRSEMRPSEVEDFKWIISMILVIEQYWTVTD